MFPVNNSYDLKEASNPTSQSASDSEGFNPFVRQTTLIIR